TFLDIIEELRSGKLPTNEQLDRGLKYMHDSSPMGSIAGNLSTEGQRLWSDLREVMTTLRRILVEKNQDEDLQSMLYH
ncbi:hypothetical protein BC831DRAFT_393201, partial [Entophlyctis helioformis]